MIKALFKTSIFVAVILFLSQVPVGNRPIGVVVHEKGLDLWNMVSDEATPRKLVAAIGDIQIVKKRVPEVLEKPARDKHAAKEDKKNPDKAGEVISDEDRQSLMQLLQ